MKKAINYIFAFIFSLMYLTSCVEDESAYEPQIKEDVEVDDVTPDKEPEEPEPENGVLVPGLHLVKLQVPSVDTDGNIIDGQTEERRFKYFMPISIDVTKPISLIFDFHGSYEWKQEGGGTVDNAPDPLDGISSTHYLCQHAIRENCIIVIPAGEAVCTEEGGYVNWQNSAKHLPFVDAMVKYFKESTPTVDANRIYSTGQSSGAIFSFVLAFERSEVFAAIAPRAGQMNIDKQTSFPTRAVPVRVFAGVDDDIVSHDAVISNMTAWAEKIGGYFESDMVYTEDSIEIENYKIIDTRVWHGGNADYEIFSLKEEGHGIVASRVLPYMWEFFRTHTLDNASTHCFVTSSIKELEVQCGQPISIDINFSEGATVTLENAPESWSPLVTGKLIKMVAPTDFFANIQREGTMTLIAEKDGQRATLDITYKLNAPKTYFEVGDIYYNENFEPVGVVAWVNQSNIREAKIIDITGVGKYGTIFYCGKTTGLGMKFDTPDMNDGEGNTKKMMEYNAGLKKPYTTSDAAFVWAAEYRYKGVEDWYLPAINELEAIAPNLDAINQTLKTIGGVVIPKKLFSSTTIIEEGADRKSIYSYDFTLMSMKGEIAKQAGSEYFGYINVRAMKSVTK